MVDFKKLYSIFVDESMERLSEIEDGLLQLEKSPADRELINTIFRAAHTIKGSSGSIGLKDISVFTHHIEEILDLIRQNELKPDKELINVLLNAADMIKEMVGCVAADTPFEFSRCGNLINRMEIIKRDRDLASNAQELKMFKIIFVPSTDLIKRGIDPLIIIDDLISIGEIISINANIDEVPELSDIDPENLYLRWDILLKTDKGVEEIKRVFEFVEDGSEIKILPVTSYESEMPMGRVLINEGTVKAEDVKEALKVQKKSW